jgi:hypothetical protein
LDSVLKSIDEALVKKAAERKQFQAKYNVRIARPEEAAAARARGGATGSA